jgi:hypothetical protein
MSEKTGVMRLTLRTLLAYLDDRLSSANAREIGKKLKDSPFAQELAGRIRTVVRQRRLMTPGRKIKMIDPNLIAEYLDDQLTPELVSLIEKEVLASDFSLAEAAASHEILGLLGDSVDLDDRLRQRLLKEALIGRRMKRLITKLIRSPRRSCPSRISYTQMPPRMNGSHWLHKSHFLRNRPL